PPGEGLNHSVWSSYQRLPSKADTPASRTGALLTASACGFKSSPRSHLHWGLAVNCIGRLTSRTGRSIPPGCAGASRPSVRREDCSERELVAKLSNALM